MRKVSVLLVVTLALVLLAAAPALAAPLSSGSNIHGGYTADTAACGQCHSTHAAAGANLIQNLETGTQNDTYRTCVYCHKSGGQSKYDVVNGAIETASATYAASAGGFAQVVTVEGATPTKVASLSKHDADGTAGASVWVPGYATTGSDMELTCAGCHDPHNTANTSRALRVNLLGQDFSATPADLTITNELADESIQYKSNWNTFCGACHKDFEATEAGSGDTGSGTYGTYKRHRVGMDPAAYTGTNSASWSIAALSQPSGLLPLETTDGLPANQKVNCLTCHYAHGTKASNTVAFNRADGTTTNSSTLLRLDNRGVCEACHNK